MKNIIFILIVLSSFMFSSCEELFKEQKPTKSAMEGVWKATAVYDSNGNDITSQLAFPVLGFHLSSDNTLISTAGPLTMFIVYGPNNYTKIASKIDQVFNYATLSFNGGEFFVGGGVQERFTIELKLEGLPGQKAITTLLETIGIGNDYLDVVIYHKFMDVKVSFENDYKTMIWEFDDKTIAEYNTKDKYGKYVLWQGWPTNSFQKCRIVLEKQTESLKDIVQKSS